MTKRNKTRRANKQKMIQEKKNRKHTADLLREIFMNHDEYMKEKEHDEAIEENKMWTTFHSYGYAQKEKVCDACGFYETTIEHTERCVITYG